jgi:tRNA dimethylallyltransferase
MRRIANKVIFIVGPTAIGKTDFAVQLAKRINGEIISADSMQAYKAMRILSQAPSPAQKKKVKHHLVEFIDPKREYSVAVFIKEASRHIGSIIAHGKTPVVVGGSGLYVKGLIDGLFPSPEADLSFREKMKNFAARNSSRKLHARLARIDPESAKKIHPNDLRRIIRALEIYNSTGKTMTQLKANTHGLKDKYKIRIFGLTRPREDIYSHIDARVDKMFRAPIIAEVKRLRRRCLSRTAKMALGFGEISGYLDGLYDKQAAIDMLKMNTRRFAKRQLTWFKSDKRIKWFDLSKAGNSVIIKKVAKGA